MRALSESCRSSAMGDAEYRYEEIRKRFEFKLLQEKYLNIFPCETLHWRKHALNCLLEDKKMI